VQLDLQKKLTSGQHHCGKGRNGRGIITARHKGGGHKRLYRQIDFRRDKEHISGKIVTIEYDPNRSAYICKVHYKNGDKMYILHPRGVMIGDTIKSRDQKQLIGFTAKPIKLSLIQLGHFYGMNPKGKLRINHSR
jgi:large subunit ribosomal protein L2